MPLTAKHRSSLYQSLAPILGEEETDALLSQYPGSEVDTLVTTGQLQAGLAELRSELQDLRVEVRGEIAAVRVEMSELRVEMAELRTGLHQALRRQTVWMVSAMFTGIGLVLAVASITNA